MWPYASSPPSPTAATAPTATPTGVVLPYSRDDATQQGTGNNAHASAIPHDELRRPAVPGEHADDATTNAAGDDDAPASTTGDAHDGTLLCSQPANPRCPHPTAAVLGTVLTGRGGQ